jgi:hypothetical protein
LCNSKRYSLNSQVFYLHQKARTLDGGEETHILLGLKGKCLSYSLL